MLNKITCCDDHFGLIGDGRCTNCPYLIQCTDNQKEAIKENLEEINIEKRNGLDKGDLLG